MKKKSGFSHLDERGQAKMVDVGAKPPMRRTAEAEGWIRMAPETVEAIRLGSLPKGDVLCAARIAGILAAKRVDELIPLCHPLPLDAAAVDFELEQDAIRIIASARCDAKTGVEMEALTAASIAALTIYDMCKSADKTMRIDGIRLVRKEKSAID